LLIFVFGAVCQVDPLQYVHDFGRRDAADGD